jgi:hypothetical protein
MKIFIVLFVAVFTFTSCGIIRNLTGPKEDKSVTKEDVKKVEKPAEKTETKENISSGGNDEIVIKDFNKNDLPTDVKYQGNIVSGKRWSDKNGENIVILTLTKEHNTGKVYNEDYKRSKELYAYQYVNKSGDWSQLWKVNDLISECSEDLTLEFLDGSLTITDLNKDGIAETTFIYKMACRGDVSPCDMKLIMHEGETKYAIRGIMKLYTYDAWYGDKMTVDKSFDNAPSGFLEYAKAQWNKFKTEKIN